jgi:hypothetical protein
MEKVRIVNAICGVAKISWYHGRKTNSGKPEKLDKPEICTREKDVNLQ